MRVRDARTARKLLAKVLRGLQEGTADLAVARTVIYGCSVYAAITETADIEARLEEVEQRIHNVRGVV